MQRIKRHKRVRAKISGTSSRPRLSVFRSMNAIYAQLIDDEKSKTIASSSCRETKGEGKIDKAFKVGELIAEKALTKKIKEVVFDRGGYKYHGRVKQLAEGARKKGLKF
jgi:large subunit ribosomal protein L18